MDPYRFDAVTKLFANRRIWRRQVIATTGGSLAASAAAGNAVAASATQQGTPVSPREEFCP